MKEGEKPAVHHYGFWHNKYAEFGIRHTESGEQIHLKSMRKKFSKQIIFDWLSGANDENVKKKMAVCFLKEGNGAEFSLDILEVVNVLKKLGSKEALGIWQFLLKYKPEDEKGK
jgi:hypothetical protein